jgi:adenine/guanine phosphoribosyltransferase-like PRPP-binding protein
MIMNVTELLNLKPENFLNEDIPVEEMLSWFDIMEAYWYHDGNPKRPHAELTSGKCSNGFFDCLRVLKSVILSQILANQLARKIRQEVGDQPIDYVIGSPMAGITFSRDVARMLGATYHFFTEKHPIQIAPGATVLQVEELTTTAKTLNAVKKAVDAGNKTPVDWLPVVGILVHRPEKLPVEFYGERKTIALIEKEIWAANPTECHLCAAGSSRLKPKFGDNWGILTGKIPLT